jgi:hypothetical protein
MTIYSASVRVQGKGVLLLAVSGDCPACGFLDVSFGPLLLWRRDVWWDALLLLETRALSAIKYLLYGVVWAESLPCFYWFIFGRSEPYERLKIVLLYPVFHRQEVCLDIEGRARGCSERS